MNLKTWLAGQGVKVYSSHETLYPNSILSLLSLFSSLMSLVKVTITVLDVNDHSPVFESVPITFELTENPLVNQSVGTVEATDEDILENGEIVYSGSSDNFMVDPTSGEIRVVNAIGLDREMNPAFLLMITASNKGTPVR